MLFMNGWEVEDACHRFGTGGPNGPDAGNETPNLWCAAQTLANLVDWTDRNSDGWAYWPKPVRAAEKLMRCIDTASGRGDVFDIEHSHLVKILTPVKAFLTRQGVDHAAVIVNSTQRKAA